MNRLIAVPKDERGPRLIASEPVSMMFAQQGLAVSIMHYIEHHTWARHHIRFTNQSFNAELCRDLKYATIDLKDASDRVSLGMVSDLFQDTPIYERLLALRSRSVELPSGIVHSPTCYATMGNALCFPIESICFWALTTAIQKIAGCNRTATYVYGDDIIVDRDNVELVVEYLAHLGLVVNTTKTCYKTPFRESCGAEWFGGEDVTITRFKTASVTDTSSAYAMCSYVRSLVERGSFVYTARALASKLTDIGYPVPYGLGPLSVLLPGDVMTRWSKRYQELQVLALTTSNRVVEESRTDEHGLYAWFTGITVGPSLTRKRPRGRVSWLPYRLVGPAMECAPVSAYSPPPVGNRG